MVYELKQPREMQVAKFEPAFKRLVDKLIREGFRVNNVFEINFNRYKILFLEKDSEKKNILVMYKREPFFNFGVMFRKEGQSGVGDTVNSEDLQKAHYYKVKDIYAIFPNAMVYHTTMENFLNKSFRWINKEGKAVRSISIHEYERVMEI